MMLPEPMTRFTAERKSKIKFVVRAHDHADNWFEQCPIWGILVQEKGTKLLNP